MMSEFSKKVISWQKVHGRHDLPWQVPNPYYRWLSEVMLQQTQVTTVLPYFQRFVERFPTIEDLAQAPEDEVMGLWAGLGYYSRARNLHRCAQLVCERYQGEFPQTREALESLPGIGRSTAAAIAAFSFAQKEAILDGNVKRVLCRYFAMEGHWSLRAVEKQLWSKAEALLPEDEIEIYTQALMDLGALICTRNPVCEQCPLAQSCQANRLGRQKEFPSPKPAKARPEKTRTFLLLWQDDYLYLQKRQQSGIWPGLYSLPELEGEVEVEAAQEYLETLGFEIKNSRQLAALRHDFSHYRLHLNPIAFAIKGARLGCDEGVWVDMKKEQALGLPAPIEKLVKRFFAD